MIGVVSSLLRSLFLDFVPSFERLMRRRILIFGLGRFDACHCLGGMRRFLAYFEGSFQLLGEGG